MKTGLPAIPASRGAQRLVFSAAIGVAYLLLGWLAIRITTQAPLAPWIALAALVAGIAAADFVSGLVHWAADTWGRDDLPFVGPHLLVPFRVHHINPHDFLQRDVVDVNGDVALLAAPMLLGLASVPIDTSGGAAVLTFGAAFCAASMLTNQIHQWAHMPRPPRVVRVLQSCRLVLGAAGHEQHHRRPYDVRYCITTGWWNRPLERVGFFRGLERIITRATGLPARGDDRRYEQRYVSTGR